MQALQVNNRRGKKWGKKRYDTHAKHVTVKALVLLPGITDTDSKQGTSWSTGAHSSSFHMTSNWEDQLIHSGAGLPLGGT